MYGKPTGSDSAGDNTAKNAKEAPMTAQEMYPVKVEGELEQSLSRWLWLVKWLLLIPHLVCLVFLWVAFGLTTIVAFVAILFTGRYPRRLFDFNVGVLRWTWRVAFYSYNGLATDQYPPFTLREAPDTRRGSRSSTRNISAAGCPSSAGGCSESRRYGIAGLLAGGLFGLGSDYWGGVLAVLMLVVALLLLFRNTYPRGIFDLAMGLNRWVIRTGAYAALLTREYPPFRLDQGTEPPAAPQGSAIAPAVS